MPTTPEPRSRPGRERELAGVTLGISRCGTVRDGACAVGCEGAGTSARTPPRDDTVAGMTPSASTPLGDRVVERPRAVALARHYREAEGLSIAQIASRLGRSPATIKAYFYDPAGEKARAVKARYQGVCRGCGASTQARNGKGDAYEYCKALPPRCHPAALDAATRGRRDAEVAHPLRPTALFLRLVACSRPTSGSPGARATGRRRVARGERCGGSLRDVVRGSCRGRAPRGGWAARTTPGHDDSVVWCSRSREYDR